MSRASEHRRAAAWALMGGGLLACRQDMHDQPRYKPLAPSSFFSDGTSARPLPAGTIPRDAPEPDARAPLTAGLLARGRERFDIFCSPCHGLAGDGKGMIPRRGFQAPSTYHSDRLRRAPAGYFFEVMTQGYGAMPSYAAQIPQQDRWAIVAYIRALQLSQHLPAQALPPAEQALLQATGSSP